ncbi:MAG TPA: glycosyltransferase family 9 protein, partial [Candidatus Omnitrophota bacterium]|nr:glycosyltransferase family 9 protein [Candidatus Omnitrophota bacterium]
ILVGKTSLMELASVIKRCQVYVSPDSCPLHLAASVRTPFVALFGPTSSRRHLPPSRRYIVLERSLSCAPCYSGTCKIFTHVCMKDISAEEVLAAVDRLMEPASGGGT